MFLDLSVILFTGEGMPGSGSVGEGVCLWVWGVYSPRTPPGHTPWTRTHIYKQTHTHIHTLDTPGHTHPLDIHTPCTSPTMVNKLAGRILLECFLVSKCDCVFKYRMEWVVWMSRILFRLCDSIMQLNSENNAPCEWALTVPLVTNSTNGTFWC